VSPPPDRSTRKSDRGGSAAVEFALIGPILIAVLLAAVVYGGWFLMAQSVQSLASEAARASIDWNCVQLYHWSPTLTR
jgi:Flp pilus assembly protein TadG